jgi:hypothetical protein
MILYSAAHLINLSNQLGLDAAEPHNSNYDNELVDLWSNNKCDWKYFYSSIDEEEAEERNIRIQLLRNKHIIIKRENKHTRYGSAPFNYISKYHKELFLEIVTALKLAKPEPQKLRTEKLEAVSYTEELKTDELSYSFEDLKKCEKVEDFVL